MFKRFEKNESKKCPRCRFPLEEWGSMLNLVNKTETKMWICRSCKYERETCQSLV